MSTTQYYQKKIADKLVFLQRKLERYTDLGLVDEKKALESVMCRLLNLIYGYKLTNLNHIQTNYPAIDLGDTGNRIAFQVTSTNSREKVRDTILKFEKHELFTQYDRLIILVTGERKAFSKDFERGNVSFSAENDIWDFHTLTRDIEKLSFEKLRAIYGLLEREYPGTNTKILRMVFIFCVFGFSLLLVILWKVNKTEMIVSTQTEALETHAPHTYSYETNMDWLNMDEVAAILSDQSVVNVYKSGFGGNQFFQGAALTVLYNNLDDRDRYITRFTVYAENIEEDLSPKLWYYSFTGDGMLTYWCENAGWGGTGEFTIEFLGMKLNFLDKDQTCVDVTLRQEAVTSWEFSSIEPGEIVNLPLFSVNDFLVEYKESFEGYVIYDMEFRLYSQETQFEEIMPCSLYVYPDKLDFLFGGGGQGDERNYVVWVETSEPEWQETFTVQQCLPANETVRLPIFIVPEKSCTMTVRIEFETLDGEIIQATPLENAYFSVPYYDDPKAYIDGKLLDWDRLTGMEVIYFPFVETQSIISKED